MARSGEPTASAVFEPPVGRLRPFGRERRVTLELTITLEDTGKRAALFGSGDRHLRLIKGTLGVQIAARQSSIKLSGSTRAVGQAASVLE